MTKLFPGYVTERVQIRVRCDLCNGSGFQNTKHGPIPCTNNSCHFGEVWTWINVVRHETPEEK
jgi:hypothetical protein